jgi:predicted outer membrane repeat protein
VLIMSLVTMVQAATFSPHNVNELIASIEEANRNGEADVITLTREATYTLTEIVDNTNGANGLPSITSDITIQGEGATIERDASAPAFRIFHVAMTGNLSLVQLSVRYGLAATGDGWAKKHGGGIFIDGSIEEENAFENGTLVLISSMVSHNVAEGNGGAIYNNDAVLDMIDSTLSGNTARNGGALYNFNGGMLLRDSTFSDNRATYQGGAVFIEDGGALLNNTTLSGNVAVDRGGALNVSNGGLQVIHSTITRNSAIEGGGIFNSMSGIDLFHSLVAQQDSGGDCAGNAIASGNYNLDSDGSCLVSPATGDLAGVDPLLGPLANNGGHTMTHELLKGSPAKDAVDPAACLGPFYFVGLAAYDQRGVLRPQDTACDIGAVEVEGKSNAHTRCAYLGDNKSSYPLDLDVFQFTATANQPAAIILQADHDSQDLGQRATLIWYDVIPEASFFQAGFGPSLPGNFVATLPATGTYQVVVAEQSESIFAGEAFKGSYCLTLVSPEGAKLKPTKSVE